MQIYIHKLLFINRLKIYINEIKFFFNEGKNKVR
jgi:hypothetical protein